jgi:hypothetical protein
MPDIVSQEVIQRKIFEIRGQKVMLDSDLSKLYGVETRTLNQAVKRNLKRFPQDFMIKLDKGEFESLRSQIVISKNVGRGGRRSQPYAFTEQGVAMLSTVLNSRKAIEINIQIMRAFVRLRSILSENAALKYAIDGLESRMSKNERDIQIAINAIHRLLNPPEDKKKKRKMGFTAEK